MYSKMLIKFKTSLHVFSRLLVNYFFECVFSFFIQIDLNELYKFLHLVIFNYSLIFQSVIRVS